MNQETKQKKTCLHCSAERENGIHCNRCRALTDMINAIEAYAGSPLMCGQLVGSLLAADVTTTQSLKQRGITENIPKLVGLAKRLRAIEANNKQNGLLGIVIKNLNKKHAKEIPFKNPF